MRLTKSLLFYLLLATAAYAWPGGYTTFFKFTINPGQVSSTQSGFTVLFLGNAALKGTGSGGCSHNSNGYDIIYASDSGGTTLLPFELPAGTYSSTTGMGQWWVKTATLNNGTVIYGACGNLGVTTYQGGAVAGAWDSRYRFVWHGGTPSALNLAASVGGFALTNTNSAAVGAGAFGGAVALKSASSQYLSVSGATSVPATAMSLSAWAKPASSSGYTTITGVDGTDPGFFDVHLHNNALAIYVEATAGTSDYDRTGSHTISNGAWVYVAATYDAVNGLIGYVNGAVDGTGPALGAVSSYSLNPTISIGNNLPNFPTRYFDGAIGEVRIATGTNPPSWTQTEYNNQVSPTSFYTFALISGGGSPAIRHRVIGN